MCLVGYKESYRNWLVPSGSLQQWCAYKSEQPVLQGEKKPCFLAFADFHGVNTPPVVDFKLLSWGMEKK